MSNHWEDWKEVEDWNEWMRECEDEPTVLQQVALGVLMVAVLFMFLCIGEMYF